MAVPSFGNEFLDQPMRVSPTSFGHLLDRRINGIVDATFPIPYGMQKFQAKHLTGTGQAEERVGVKPGFREAPIIQVGFDDDRAGIRGVPGDPQRAEETLANIARMEVDDLRVSTGEVKNRFRNDR